MQVKNSHFQGASNIYGTNNERGLPSVLNSKVDREPLDPLAPVPAGATLADLITAHNNLLAALKSVPPQS